MEADAVVAFEVPGRFGMMGVTEELPVGRATLGVGLDIWVFVPL